MSVKILGGFAKGLELSILKTEITRPTTVMIRRRIFDSFQDLSDVCFVDLCAGTGAMGFEAYSRYALKTYLVEKDKLVFKLIQENIQKIKTKFEKNIPLNFIECSNQSCDNFLIQFKKNYSEFENHLKETTLLFLDPPYNDLKTYQSVLEILNEENWYFGILWIEIPLDSKVHLEMLPLNKYEIIKEFKQGSSHLLVLKSNSSTHS